MKKKYNTLGYKKSALKTCQLVFRYTRYFGTCFHLKICLFPTKFVYEFALPSQNAVSQKWKSEMVPKRQKWFCEQAWAEENFWKSRHFGPKLRSNQKYFCHQFFAICLIRIKRYTFFVTKKATDSSNEEWNFQTFILIPAIYFFDFDLSKNICLLWQSARGI